MSGRAFKDAFQIERGLRHGWALLKIAPVPLLIGGLIMSCTEGGGGGGGQASFDESSAHHQVEPEMILFLFVALLFVLVLALALFALRCWVQPGFLRLHRSLLERGSGGFAELFSGSDKLWSIAGYKLLELLLMLGIGIVGFGPGLMLTLLAAVTESEVLLVVAIAVMLVVGLPLLVYVGLGLTMGELAITFDDATPVEAVATSWKLVQGHRWPLFLFVFVFALVQFAAVVVGLLLCCIGALVTVPAARALYGVAFTEGYLLLTRDRNETDGWWIWQPPSPGGAPSVNEGHSSV